ncbi:MAG: OB-fold nucleic acid binding domain-containing protein, partial [Halobacteriaceae archaeon]
MGSCVICGKSVDGKVCNSHEEDVLFEFYGDDPTNLVSGRYYKGTVDGFADFGVFVDLAPSTTGLLHESEIEGRLENLDWEPGDTVFVQVIGVHDSGKVDLGWSIRQSERGFRHKLIQDDTGDHEPEEYESTGTEETEEKVTSEPESSEERTTSGEQQAAQTLHQETKPERVSIANLEDHVGDEVKIEGKVVDVFQTSGPTIFQIEDETGSVDCAAFKEAGERAYPGIDTDDIVGVTGDVELHNGDIQLEADQLELLEAEARSNVTERLESALMEQARPPSVELLGEHSTVVDKRETIVETATTIRQAIFEDRPVIIRHTPTVDGYVAGAAIEHAILPLVTEKHTSGEAEYHYVERKPLDDPVYDMNAATADITSMLTAAHRHDEKYPLIVLVDAGSTRESLTGLEFLEIYDVDSVVIADGLSDSEVESVTTNFLAANTDTTAGLLGANVAANVNPDIRNDLAHLPAISFWHDVPDQYVELAASAGYDEADIRELREAVALEAY